MATGSIEMQLLRLWKQGTDLTPREKEVLTRLALGDSQQEAGENLGITYETVRKHTKVARARLGAKTSAHAVAIAISLDLI